MGDFIAPEASSVMEGIESTEGEPLNTSSSMVGMQFAGREHRRRTTLVFSDSSSVLSPRELLSIIEQDLGTFLREDDQYINFFIHSIILSEP
jgi:hypothetical protein